MNKFSRSLFITSGINASVFVLSFAAPGLFLLFFAMVVIELLAGLIMLAFEGSRETGAGMMLASAVTFLIGFSICSSLTY